MKRHQTAVQATEVVPWLFFMDDTKIGSIANGAMIERLHWKIVSLRCQKFYPAVGRKIIDLSMEIDLCCPHGMLECWNDGILSTKNGKDHF